MPRLLTDEEITRQLADLPGWTRTGSSESSPNDSIRSSVTLTDFAEALDFVVRVGRAAEQMNHHPDIDIRWNTVTLVLSTHSEGGLTQLDVELAHHINDELPKD
jgi:4a-hydroxytetrahydrobiopterin dehydratase